LTDPVMLSAAAAVTLTTWRAFAKSGAQFLQALDLSGLGVVALPARGLKGMSWLEKAVLPSWLRVLPIRFFAGCSRLAEIETTGCVALESIEEGACDCCRALRAFAFPPTIREVSCAFRGTSIEKIDLLDTLAERAKVAGMLLLGDLVLPRRCILSMGAAVPSLRRVTFGVVEYTEDFLGRATEMRFEGMTAGARFSPGLACGRVYAEVVCQMACETVPFPPP
jgi:hypothetical protein